MSKETSPIHGDKEYILCAAIWYMELEHKRGPEDLRVILPINCDRGLVFCGHRHPHCMYTMCAVTGLRSVTHADDGVGEHISGFLTNRNRFVDRDEGAEIARNAEQVASHITYLYSEDLY